MLETRYANAISVYDISNFTGVIPEHRSVESVPFAYEPDTRLVWPHALIRTSELLAEIKPDNPEPPYIETGDSRLSVLRGVFMVNRAEGKMTILLPTMESDGSIEDIKGMRLESGKARPFAGPAGMFKNDYVVALRAAAVWMTKINPPLTRAG